MSLFCWEDGRKDYEMPKYSTTIASDSVPEKTSPEDSATELSDPTVVHSQESALKLATKAHALVEQALLEAYALVQGTHDELATSRSSIGTLLQQWRACWPGNPKVI